MIKVYNNQKCSKCCAALAYLENKGIPYETVNYLQTPPTVEELKTLVALLGCKPMDIVRTGEELWEEQFEGKQMSDDEVLATLVKHPTLLQRPIVVNGNKAVIARPDAEKIEQVL